MKIFSSYSNIAEIENYCSKNVNLDIEPSELTFFCLFFYSFLLKRDLFQVYFL